MAKTRVIIMGAAGRDFHNFNVFFRGNPEYEVVAFTATQIPGIEGKRYPPGLSGGLYPNGIPIHSETRLVDLVRILRLNKPAVRVRYELAERGTPNLESVLGRFLKTHGL